MTQEENKKNETSTGNPTSFSPYVASRILRKYSKLSARVTNAMLSSLLAQHDGRAVYGFFVGATRGSSDLHGVGTPNVPDKRLKCIRIFV